MMTAEEEYEESRRARQKALRYPLPWRIWAYGFWLADVLPDSMGFPLFAVLTFGSAGLVMFGCFGLFALLSAQTWFSWVLLGVLLSWGLRFVGRVGRAYIREALKAEQDYRRYDDAD